MINIMVIVTIVVLIIFSVPLGMAVIALWKTSRDMEDEMEYFTSRRKDL